MVRATIINDIPERLSPPDSKLHTPRDATCARGVGRVAINFSTGEQHATALNRSLAPRSALYLSAFPRRARVRKYLNDQR